MLQYENENENRFQIDGFTKAGDPVMTNGRRGTYTTDAYRELLRYMAATDQPQSATAVYEAMRKTGAHIGQTTVYRQLLRLSREGVIEKLPSPDGKTALYRYAGACRGDHYHLLCSECGSLSHLSCDYFADLYRHVGEHHGFHIDGSRTVFYGVCAACFRARAKRKST